MERTGIAGAADYVPAGGPGGNRCHACGHDFGEGASHGCEAIAGVGVVQFCRDCWSKREPDQTLRMAQEIAELKRQIAALTDIVEGLRKLVDEQREGAWS